ncbi:hypothetical protein [Calothrix sp. PCC 7507]|uniref:hypothetical protein n=1 Tax=Calothrix sp. PCC 7507 TaxID=99598 RepID=UPI00029F1BCB|nr:hypothetical protein [Calothrix sp. PCC 7507]AFY30708.1 hypothetical protein Cal7507_0206 [Calothrix sp. PCC 7507]
MKNLSIIIGIFSCLIAPLAVQAEPQIVSPNAYKVPFLGLDGTFLINQDHKASVNDPRNPKRLEISKMEKFSFYADDEGKQAIAKNCTYIYMGAAKDPKFYALFKSAIWDQFELAKEEKADPGCDRFKHITVVVPHGDPAHMHFRYGDQKSDFTTILNMSNTPEDKKTFSPWFATYCNNGKNRCGEG